METKICKRCSLEKPVSEFTKHSNKGRITNYRKYCNLCRYQLTNITFKLKNVLISELNQEDRDKVASKLLARIRDSARQRDLECNLTEQDFQNLPTHCPVLGIPLFVFSDDLPKSISVDRIDNDKGYLKNNIVFVSRRANRLKSDATLDELSRLVEFYRGLSNA